MLSLENIKQNIQRIYEIIRSEYVDEDEFADAEIMILNIVVCIGKALKEPNIFMSKSDIFAYLKIINDIIKEILDR